jgi:hypothetical protein
MAYGTFFERMRSVDIRVWASIGASLLLIAGVMWIIPFTPNSDNFTFDTARRDIAQAAFIEIEKPVQGRIVDGSDADFYRIKPAQSAVRLDVHIANGSKALIPSIRIYDTTKNLVVEKSKEYIKRPGADLDCTFLAQSSMTYYVEVMGQRNTIGPYTLTVSIRKP